MTDERFQRSNRAGRFLLGGVVVGLALWVLVFVRSLQTKPGVEGWLIGVFGGALVAFFSVGGAAMIFMISGPGRKEDHRPPENLRGSLKDTLDELEALRKRTAAQIKARTIVLVPLACVGAVALWWFFPEGGVRDPDDLFAFLIAGAVGGYALASYTLSNAYARRYKEAVLPQLAAQFGELTWRRARAPIAEIERWRLFPRFDSAHADDEIAGTYRGMPTSLLELRLTAGSGKNKRTVFAGLIATVTLPRALRGVTVITADKGALGNLADRVFGRDCERVALEDPAFEKVFEVFGTDQIGARALLTPAFMERFLALTNSGRFGRPVALARDNTLLLALSTMSGDLFEPPSYWKPAAGRDALQRLSAEIRTVLNAADAVIDLDQAARRAEPSGAPDAAWS